MTYQFIFSHRITSALLLFLLICGNTLGQTISGINPSSGNAGQTINMIITGSGTNFTSSTGAYLYRPGWFIQEASGTANSNTNYSATFNLPPNAQLGDYEIGVWPAYVPNGFTMLASQSGSYGYISGRVVLDQNQNCLHDIQDVDLGNKIVEVLPGPYYASTDPNTGEYGLWVPLGNYTVQMTVPQGQVMNCPVSGSHSVNLTVAGDSTNNNDFFLFAPGPPPFFNLKVLAVTSAHRPGFSANTQFKVYNDGNQIMSGYTLTGTVSSSLDHKSESPAAASVTGNTMTWNIPPMVPGQIETFTSYDSLPASIPIGTSLLHTGVISPGDDHNADNTFNGSRIVTGSYDPNDKQVWNADGENADGFIVPTDSVLQYLIRCQNTGTDTAFNIYIRDTLDSNLDVNTLQVIDASHNYQLSVSGPGYLQFTFPNILLVDSATNEPGSNAHIEYTIQTKPGLAVGTQIDNTAHIYFDFNAPIVTNTVSSVICPEFDAAFGISTTNLVASFSDSTAGSIAQYQWDFGDGNTSNQQNPTHSYTLSGTYTVCLIATNNCGRQDTTCQMVSVSCPAPVSNFSFNPTFTNVSFSDLSTNNPVGWLWDFGDGNTSNQQNPSHSYSLPGNYTVCLIVSSSCGSQDTMCQTVFVTCPAPTSAFTFSGNITGMNFTDMSTNNPTSWFWDFGDGNTSILQNPQHTYATIGNYSVCLTAVSNCGSDSSCSTVGVSVGINEGPSQEMVVYPNPTSGEFVLELELAQVSDLNFQLFDALGQTIADYQLGMVGGAVRQAISISDQPAGIYFLRINVGGESVVKKIQKE